ncbi:hypothetical protein [Synechococcus sp. PCC 7336]|uniref:hypothetical protein n=1 Tax=Synechococcus sp. PCC 7336 TaxID=195250 RepID=UPI00034A485C
MILCIAGVLSASELDTANKLVDRAEFIDGKLTAGWHARLVAAQHQRAGMRAGADTANLLQSTCNSWVGQL